MEDHENQLPYLSILSTLATAKLNIETLPLNAPRNQSCYYQAIDQGESGVLIYYFDKWNGLGPDRDQRL